MNTTRLIEIAKRLIELYNQRGAQSLRLWHAEQDLELRQVALIPAEGWPGKNEGERKTAQTKAYKSDDVCEKIEAQIARHKTEVSTTDAEIAGLEAERRALEWEIRGELVKALQREHLEYSGPVEETAFDEALQSQLDELPF